MQSCLKYISCWSHQTNGILSLLKKRIFMATWVKSMMLWAQKEEALKYYEQALSHLREVGNRSGEGTTLNNLGVVYNALGQKEEALKYYEQALGI